MFNANNYGYYNPTRPMYQPMQPQQEPFNSVPSRPILNGKQVDNIEVVKAMDIPLDGSISYFPLADGSAILTKQLQKDGTSKTIIYKPIENEPDIVKFVTLEDFDDLKDELSELKQEIKTMKKKVKDE